MITFNTKGVCSQKITFKIDNGIIKNVNSLEAAMEIHKEFENLWKV